MTLLFFLSLAAVTSIPVVLLSLVSTKGRAGEKLVAYALKISFPKGTIIFNDLYFHNGKRSCQIDHLVVSPTGIFVIETKNYLGLVYGDALDNNIRRRVLGRRYKSYNPAKQNERHLDYLKENLFVVGSKADALRSIVVFAAFTRLQLKHNPGNIGTLRQLPAMIKRYSRPKLLSNDECRLIAAELRTYNRR